MILSKISPGFLFEPITFNGRYCKFKFKLNCLRENTVKCTEQHHLATVCRYQIIVVVSLDNNDSPGFNHLWCSHHRTTVALSHKINPIPGQSTHRFDIGLLQAASNKCMVRSQRRHDVFPFGSSRAKKGQVDEHKIWVDRTEYRNQTPENK